MLVLACLGAGANVDARALEADIAAIRLPVATLERVHVRLDWPAGATEGTLTLHAARVHAPDLAIDARNLAWTCPLRRAPSHGWTCDGTLRSGRNTFALGVAFDDAGTTARLRQGRAVFAVQRGAATPDFTRIDLTRVPIAWAQSLLAKSWADARLQGGTLDGRIDVAAPERGPLRITGRLDAAGVKLETTDATIAADNLAGTFDFDYRIFDAPKPSLLTLDGTLRGGEFLAGSTYVALPATPVALSIAGEQREGAGGTLPRIAWKDGTALDVEGSAAFADDATLRALDVRVHSGDLAPVRDRYLSGLLGTAGLGDLTLAGALDARVRVADGVLQAFDVTPHAVDIVDEAGQRFAFDDLDGDMRFSRTGAVTSTLSWAEGALYGLAFGPARLHLRS